MTRLDNHLRRACEALGLPISAPCAITLPDGQKLNALALIEYIGGPRGTLVFEDYDLIASMAHLLLDAGYGYAVLEEPRVDDEFDLDSYRDMFIDWGWAAVEKPRPKWMD